MWKYTNFGEMMNYGMITCKCLYVQDNMMNNDWISDCYAYFELIN